MKKFAIIVGGGKGIRLGSEIPKQFMPVNGIPAVFYSLQKFSVVVDEMVLVLPDSHFDYWKQLCDKFLPNFTYRLVAGGDTRALSVKNGLDTLLGGGIVAIHDAVRPIVSTNLILRVFDEALRFGNAVPFIPVRESLRKRNTEGSESVKREDYLLIQTPQCFDLLQIKAAYAKADNLVFSDDAGLFEHFGGKIHHVEGETANIKITFPEDLKLAEALLNTTIL